MFEHYEVEVNPDNTKRIKVLDEKGIAFVSFVHDRTVDKAIANLNFYHPPNTEPRMKLTLSRAKRKTI